MYDIQCCIVMCLPTGKYHPIYFRYSPPPSGDFDGGYSRYKSGGHHTQGFDTQEAAEAALVKLETALKEQGDVCRCPNYSIDNEDFVEVLLLKMDGNYGPNGPVPRHS